MNDSKSTCPDSPHAHLFSMKCYKCGAVDRVVHECGFSDFLDSDSPDYDETMKERRATWLKGLGLLMAPSKTTGELGVVCTRCNALHGGFFIMDEFMEIAHRPQEYETVVMPKAL